MRLIAAGLARARWSGICCFGHGDPRTITRNGPTMGACRETEHRSDQRISNRPLPWWGYRPRLHAGASPAIQRDGQRGVEAMARQHNEAAIKALIEVLSRPRGRLSTVPWADFRSA